MRVMPTYCLDLDEQEILINALDLRLHQFETGDEDSSVLRIIVDKSDKSPLPVHQVAVIQNFLKACVERIKNISLTSADRLELVDLLPNRLLAFIHNHEDLIAEAKIAQKELIAKMTKGIEFCQTMIDDFNNNTRYDKGEY